MPTLRLFLVSLCLLLSLTQLASFAAAQDDVVLTITGDRVALDEAIERLPAPRLIAGYYALLPEARRRQAVTLQQDLARLMPAYEVAWSAADTAELNGVTSAIADQWARIRTLHAREFTQDVITSLGHAYATLYPVIAPRD